MNFVKGKKFRNNRLLEILNRVDLKEISKKEANFFSNKRSKQYNFRNFKELRCERYKELVMQSS